MDYFWQISSAKSVFPNRFLRRDEHKQGMLNVRSLYACVRTILRTACDSIETRGNFAFEAWRKFKAFDASSTEHFLEPVNFSARYWERSVLAHCNSSSLLLAFENRIYSSNEPPRSDDSFSWWKFDTVVLPHLSSADIIKCSSYWLER